MRKRTTDRSRAMAAVEIDPGIRGGEPVVRGTRIPAYMLADLVSAGETRERLLVDHPALDAKRLDDALLYVSLHPAPKHTSTFIRVRWRSPLFLKGWKTAARRRPSNALRGVVWVSGRPCPR